jgi:tetratricopeptide (TPR) repeat protein
MPDDTIPLAAAPAPPLDPPVFHTGQLVANRYRIIRYISRGGMGEVYEVRDLDLGLDEPVALKTILPAIASDESTTARFKQEIALSRKISHPNVCKVFDLSRHEAEGRVVLFLTMEFLAGETLAAKLQRDGPMSQAAALPILEQMAAALDASHQSGVVHRDFKPSNVMLVPSGETTRVAVTDFGLARRSLTPDETATIGSGIVGTLDYMAPELLTGVSANAGSDVYALGMTAFNMVTGTLPFRGQEPLAGAILRSNRTVPSPRGFAPNLEANWDSAITRALDPDPAKRFATARDFILALGGHAVPVASQTPLLTRRRIAIMAAVVLAAGAFFAWRAFRTSGLRLPPDAQAAYDKGAADISAGAYFASTRALEDAAKIAPRAPMIHARLAEAWVELDLPEKAGQEMLLVKREDLSALPRPERLRIQAIDLSITREFAAAAAKYEELARATGNSSGVEVDLGRAYEHADRPDDAIRSYRLAAEGPDRNPAAWLRLGALYARQAKRAPSDEAFAQATRLYQLTSNLEGLTEVALQQGIAANARGQIEAAAALLNKALDTARLADNLQEEINATLRLCTNAFLSGDAAAAERYANQALETARANRLEAMAIRGLIGLGNAFRRKQDFAQSEQRYNEALNLARQNRSGPLIALSQISLASLHDETRDRKQSVVEAQGALAYYQANRYARESLQCLTLIARAQRDSGDYAGALASFRGMLDTAEKIRDRPQIAVAHESIAAILFRQDKFPDSLAEYQKSLDLGVNDEQSGYASLDCASTVWHLGRYSDAIALFEKAGAVAEKFPALRIDVISARAAMLLSQGRLKDAADLARRALSSTAPRPPDVQAALLQTACLSSPRPALKPCEDAWSMADKLDPALKLDAAVALLEARIENNQRQPALDLLHQIEPGLPSRPELRWRALAFGSRIEPAYLAQAREALAQLSRFWGDSVYNVYLTRPDVAKLSRPLH